MSFSKTVSIFAALASIFGAGAAGWKLSQDSQNPQTNPLEERIVQLEQELKEAKEQVVIQPANPPTPVVLPQVQQSQVSSPSTPQLPPPPTPAPTAPQAPTP